MSTHADSVEARRAAADHPSLQGTLRRALELVSRELPEFDPVLRRLLVAGYRAAEGGAAVGPGSRAKALALAHEAAFRSALPRTVAVCLNAEFGRLGGVGPAVPPPDADGTARARTIAALARRVAVDGPHGLAELDRRVARQLGLEALDPADNPLRPGVFLHAVGLCWRTVSGSDRHESDVIGAYGALWLPALRRLLPALVAGLPAASGAPAAASPGPAVDPAVEPASREPAAGPAIPQARGEPAEPARAPAAA